MLTVVTPCYNHANFLSEAIESVLDQTYGEFEYLLYDDGSTDNSWDVMTKYAALDRRIQCTRLHKGRRTGSVLNRSIRDAKGTHWIWVPADDILMPNLFEEQNKVAETYSPLAVLYSDAEVIDENGKVLKETRLGKKLTPEELAKEVWISSPIGFTGTRVPMVVFDEVGSFPTHTWSEDFCWTLRATIHGIPFVCIDQVLYRKRKHANMLSVKWKHRIRKAVPWIRDQMAKYKKVFEYAGK